MLKKVKTKPIEGATGTGRRKSNRRKPGQTMPASKTSRMSCERRCALTGCLLFFLTTVQAGAGWSHLSHSKKGVETDVAGSASVAAVSSNGKLAPHLQTDSKGVQHVLQMTIVGPHRSIVTPHLTAISPSLSIAIAFALKISVLFAYKRATFP